MQSLILHYILNYDNLDIIYQEILISFIMIMLMVNKTSKEYKRGVQKGDDVTTFFHTP
jgi:hypothetical protein